MKNSTLERQAQHTKQSMNYRFDKVVTLYTYGAAFGLVIYMVVSLYSAFAGIASELPHLITNYGMTPEGLQVQKEVLHTIAFTIILIKAYTVIMSYAKTKHLNPKYLLEIGIIAPIIELIFNVGDYAPWMTIFLGSFAVAITIIYLAFYQTLIQVDSDHQDKHHKD